MQKDEQMCLVTAHGSSAAGQVHKKSSFFSLPGLFLGSNSKSSSDYSDSVNSPTSPLDFRVFSNIVKSPRSPRDKIWERDKVGLSIIDSLDDGGKVYAGKLAESSDAKHLVFRPQLRTAVPKFGNSFQSFDSLDEGVKYSPRNKFGASNGKNLLNSPKFDSHFRSHEAPRSLPKNFAFPPTHFKSPLRKGSSGVVFEICDGPESFIKPRPCSLSVRPGDQAIPGSASEMELSEDYTCVTVHGPNPKTTHIYADCVLDSKSRNSSCGSLNRKKELLDVAPSLVSKNLEKSPAHPADDFLSLCNMCKKTLALGKDVYIYRGEKSFCSSECRAGAILIDKGKTREDSLEPDDGREFSEADILDT